LRWDCEKTRASKEKEVTQPDHLHLEMELRKKPELPKERIYGVKTKYKRGKPKINLTGR
jgi:hypothetical protein